uniref:Uncharacterized protein n=1 Tax=Arundo donax TaxID=35708 RepID=A0A0A9E840_ARUDO
MASKRRLASSSETSGAKPLASVRVSASKKWDFNCDNSSWVQLVAASRIKTRSLSQTPCTRLSNDEPSFVKSAPTILKTGSNAFERADNSTFTELLSSRSRSFSALEVC